MVRENIQEFSVSEISFAIKESLEENFGYVKIRGEVSGLSKPSSGHIYLKLKDEKAIINAIIWRSAVNKIGFVPEDGLEVVCSGRLTTGFSDRYPGRSDYSIIVDSLMPAGEGALMALLEKRKKDFSNEGLFDDVHKKQIPKFPQTIGVITSPTGAVIQDILNRVNDRYPCNILLWPVPVQGEDAAPLISEAIKGFNSLSVKKEFYPPDVIIIARGGGSIEDLWPFNEEIVVRSIFKSSIPVISAVGHETDTTLVDYVCDLRAPTPTAAAELSTPDKKDLLSNIEEYQIKLNISLNSFLENKKQIFKNIVDQLINIQQLFISKKKSSFQNLSGSLNLRILDEQLNSKNKDLKLLSERIIQGQQAYIKDLFKTIASISKLLNSLSYKSILNRGFSVTRNSKKEIVKSTKKLSHNESLKIETNFGILHTVLKKIDE